MSDDNAPTDDLPFPLNSLDLLRDLDKAYPHRCIVLGQTPESAHRYAGQRDVIDALLSWAREHGHDVGPRN